MENSFERAYRVRDTETVAAAVAAGVPALRQFWDIQYQKGCPDVEQLAFSGSISGKAMRKDEVQCEMRDWVASQPSPGNALAVAGYFMCTFWNESVSVDLKLLDYLVARFEHAQGVSQEALIWALGMAYFILRTGPQSTVINQNFKGIASKNLALSQKSRDYIDGVLALDQPPCGGGGQARL